MVGLCEERSDKGIGGRQMERKVAVLRSDQYRAVANGPVGPAMAV